MNDAGVMIRDSLLNHTTLQNVVGASPSRLWAYRTQPIEGYKPADGVAIAFNPRGGNLMYHNGLMSPSVRFKTWGIDEFVAMQGCLALIDALHDKSPGMIRAAQLEGLPQIAAEQDTDWVYALCFFTIWLAR